MSASNRLRLSLLGPIPSHARMPDRPGLGQSLLALAMIGLGVRGCLYGDLAGVWQHLPIAHLSAEAAIALAVALLELACGFGLLLRRTAPMAALVLVALLALWTLLLKLPGLVAMPGMEATWLGVAEISLILAGGWTLMALHGRRPGGSRGARLLFALSLLPIGLAHFVYAPQTVALMPAWLPWHLGWAWFTGAASLAAAAAVMLGLLPRLAVALEAAMLSIITLVIWLPRLIAAPGNDNWTAFLMSSAIACGAWAVLDGYRDAPLWALARPLPLVPQPLSQQA
ncbi:MAG TPA: hypothetical protein VGU03_03705 [Frateuria sp.]|uniref:hypothetical protein n=1 Tax=Frateuria sp. TaxID=2211372 RepID=UPI002DF30C66|nr:hypothetical protein [Frateuria sp.]